MGHVDENKVKMKSKKQNEHEKNISEESTNKHKTPFLHSLIIIFIDTLILFSVYYGKYSEVRFASLPIIVAFIVLVLFSVFFVSKWHSKDNKFSKYTFNLSIWLAICVFLLYVTRDHTAMGLEDFFNIVAPMFFFIIVINVINNDKDWLALSISIPLTGIIVAIISYIKYDQFTSSLTYLFSIINYNNTFAAFMVLCIFTLLGFYFEDKKGTRKIFEALAIGFLTFVLFLTTSRGGYLVFGLATVIFIFLERKNLKAISKEAWLPILFSVLLIVFFTPTRTLNTIIGKTKSATGMVIGASDDGSISGRLYMMKVSFQMFLSSPIFGIGLGNFRYEYLVRNTIDHYVRIDPHSLFFRILAETGIVGTFLYFGNILNLFWVSFKKTLSSNMGHIYIGLFAGVIGLFVHMCIDVDTYAFMFLLVFFVLALLVSKNEYEFVPVALNKQVFMKVVTVAIIIVTIFVMFPMSFSALASIAADDVFTASYNTTDTEALLSIAYKYHPTNDFYSLLLGYINLRKAAVKEQNGSTKEAIDSSVNTAIEYFKQTIKLNPNETRAYAYLGLCYLYTGDQQAITYLTIAHEKFPKSSSIDYWLSFAYAYFNKDVANAELYYNEGLTNSFNGKKDPYQYMALGALYYVKGDVENAKKTFDLFKEKRGGTQNPFFNKFGADMFPFMQNKLIDTLLGEN